MQTPPVQPPAEWPLQSPRAVRLGRGGNWIQQGFALFNLGMGVSVAVCLLTFVLSLAGQQLKGLDFVMLLLQMVLSAGNLMLAHQAWRYQRMQFNDFFAGFRQQFGALVLGQVFYLGLMLVCGLLALFITSLLPGPSLLHYSELMAQDPLQMASRMLLFVMVLLLALLPVLMASLFVAPLIFFHGLRPAAAFKLSFAACWQNAWPLTWWGLLSMLLLLIGGLLLGIGLLVVVPVISYSLYAAYRDIFLHDDMSRAGASPDDYTLV